jgi:hypothetical protein
MRFFNRFYSLLGIFGTVLCVALATGIWYVESRVDRTREFMFERVGRSLVSIDAGVVEIQKVAAKSRLTIEDLRQRATGLTKIQARDRLSARLDLEPKVETLLEGLRQADLMLDMSYDTVQQVSRALEMGAELGLSVRADTVDPLMERIAEVKSDLKTAIETATSLSERIDSNQSEIGDGERMERVAIIAARLLATFGKVDSRLVSFQSRLANAREVVEEFNAKTHARIIATAVSATLFLAWMGAGQICLWRWAQKT